MDRKDEFFQAQLVALRILILNVARGIPARESLMNDVRADLQEMQDQALQHSVTDGFIEDVAKQVEDLLETLRQYPR